jgi:hypothetical protein
MIAIVMFLHGAVSLTATACSVSSELCGRNFYGPPPPPEPASFIINVSDPVDPATVDASDFTVNGIPADSISPFSGNTSERLWRGVGPFFI